MPKPYKFYTRDFLNEDPSMPGIILAYVSESDDCKYVDAAITISDCNRSVTLAFDVYNDYEDDKGFAEANALGKARKLKSVIDGFVAALEKSCKATKKVRADAKKAKEAAEKKAQGSSSSSA